MTQYQSTSLEKIRQSGIRTIFELYLATVPLGSNKITANQNCRVFLKSHLTCLVWLRKSIQTVISNLKYLMEKFNLLLEKCKLGCKSVKFLQIASADFSPLFKKLFYLILIIYSLSFMIHRNQTVLDRIHWCHVPDQDVFVIIEAMGHNSHILPKQNEHPGYGHKLLYAYYFKLLNLLDLSEYHKLEDFCQTPEPLEIWPIIIKNARTLSFLLFIVFCLVMGLTCWQLTGKPWAFPIGFYFCSLFPGGQYQSFIIRSEFITSIMGCTGILFALASLNAKRYLSFIIFSILSGVAIFIAISTKIQGLPFLCFIVVIFLFFPTNESTFLEHISAKKLFAPASVIIFSFVILYVLITLRRFSSYKGCLLGLIIVSCLLIFLSYSLRTRLKNRLLKRILQLLSDYSPTRNKFSFQWVLANKLFAITFIIIIILIFYGTSPVWPMLWGKFSTGKSLLNNPYFVGLIIVACFLIFLSYSLRTRLENKVLKRSLSLGHFLFGGLLLGSMFVYFSLLPFHSWEASLSHWHLLLRYITTPGKFNVYLVHNFSLSFFYSTFLNWWNNYLFFLFSLICFSCFFLSSKKITIHNKSIFILLILVSYLYVSFSSLRNFAPKYYIFNDVFLILGYIYLVSELSNLIVLNKVHQSWFIVSFVAWMFLFSIFMPPVYSYKPTYKSNLDHCIHWTYPSRETKTWIHEKYFLCMEKAYPTKKVYLHNFKKLSDTQAWPRYLTNGDGKLGNGRPH